ncbi:MAG TPA: hypothetical protein VMX16_11220 [Terriglobia bacterium]|nr:hypothetical protein [Terriglobia bacterium]
MDIMSPPVLGILAPFLMVVLIVGIVMFRKVRENELRVHQELRTKEMEHERRLKELEIEKVRLELEKAKMEQKV